MPVTSTVTAPYSGTSNQTQIAKTHSIPDADPSMLLYTRTYTVRHVTAQSVRSAQNVRQREMSDKTARNVRQNLKCPTKRPEMSDEIAHSHQTMNQGNKISSVRTGTSVFTIGPFGPCPPPLAPAAEKSATKQRP